MNLVNPKSIEGYVNHFADRLVILSESYRSKFHVTFHFPNILVISGLNTSSNLFNLSKIHSDFIEEFPHYLELIGTKQVKFIDLTNNYEFTDYETTLETYWFDFHNTPRPIYNEFQISEFISPNHTIPFPEFTNLTSDGISLPKNPRIPKITNVPLYGGYYSVSSSYPYGYCKDARCVMYTSEFIAYNLFRFTKTKKLKIFNTQMSPLFLMDELSIKGDYKYSENKIVSMAIDVFDDYDMLEVVADYNIEDDLLKPIADKPWLEAWKVGEMIIF